MTFLVDELKSTDTAEAKQSEFDQYLNLDLDPNYLFDHKNDTGNSELSLLIKKINRYNQREKIKRNLFLSASIFSILIFTGLFFYTEIKISQQNIFIQKPNSPLSQENKP